MSHPLASSPPVGGSEQLPPAFTVLPSALVAFVNLAPAVHEKIKATFEEEVRTLSWGFDQIVARDKEKRPTYEGYIPQGILKTRWLQKHLYEIPAVLVVLFDLSEGDFRGRDTEMLTQIENAKSRKRRNQRLLVVFVMDRHHGESVDEKVTNFRRRADLENKQCIIFIPSEAKTVKKLEKSVLENAEIYYKEEAKRIKKHRDKLNKVTQSHLFIRHHFKIAFLGECRRDVKTAIKYYSAAYSVLKDSPHPVDRLHEIKTVAEIITRKLVEVYMYAGMVAEARDVFRKHMFVYRNQVGEPSLAFLHWASVARQYRGFAELLESVPLHIAAVQHRTSPAVAAAAAALANDRWYHPGFFYQAASEYTQRRRHAALELRTTFQESNDPVEQSLYVGQLVSPTLEGKDGAEMLQRQLRSLLGVESKLDYSVLILEILTKACEHHMKRKHSRMHVHLLSQMAREHVALSQFDKAKRVLDGVVQMLLHEGWLDIVAVVMSDLLLCSRELQLQRDLFNACMHLIGRDVPIAVETKTQHQHTVMGMLGLEDLPESLTWARFESPVTIDLDNRPFFTVAGHFHEGTVLMDGDMQFTLSITAHVVFPISCSHMRVMFSDLQFNRTIVGEGFTPPEDAPPTHIHANLVFAPEKTWQITLHLPSDRVVKLEFLSVDLHVGVDNSAVTLHYKTPDRVRKYYRDLIESKRPPSTSLLDDTVLQTHVLAAEPRPVCHVLQALPASTLVVVHDSPALQGEYFPLHLCVHSHEDHMISPVLSVSAHYASSSSSNLSSSSAALPVPPTSTTSTTGTASGPVSTRRVSTDVATTASRRVSTDLPSSAALTSRTTVPDTAPLTATTTSAAAAGVCMYRRGPGGEGYVALAETETISLPNSDPEQKLEEDVYMYATLTGTVILNLTLIYTTKREVQCVLKRQVEVEVGAPFRVAINFVTLENALVASGIDSPVNPPAPLEEPSCHMETNKQIVVHVAVESTSPHPLLLTAARLQLDPAMAKHGAADDEDGGVESEKREQESIRRTLRRMETGERSVMHFICTPIASHEMATLGSLFLSWGRLFGEEADAVIHADCLGETLVPLPTAKVFDAPFSVRVEVPSQAVLGEPVCWTLIVDNNRGVCEHMTITAANTDAFLYAGYKQAGMCVLPYGQVKVTYQLVPISVGLVTLPHIQLHCKRFEKEITHEIPNRIFVRPKVQAANLVLE